MSFNERDYLYSDKFDGDEIVAGVWMGGYPLEGEVPDGWAVAAVGSLPRSERHPGPRRVFQMQDKPAAIPSRIDLDWLVAFIHGHLQAGTPVFVHCTSGINRSGLVVGYYLCMSKQLTGEQAITLIREKRLSHGTGMTPLCNRGFADALRAWFPSIPEPT